jgi:hypothetical protein
MNTDLKLDILIYPYHGRLARAGGSRTGETPVTQVAVQRTQSQI